MFNRLTKLVAITASAAALLLTGCGRQLPASAAFRGPGYGPAALGAPVRGGQLDALQHQAQALLQRQYPQCVVYEVSGVTSSNQVGDAADFDTWVFGALDDGQHPKDTVFMIYTNGAFQAPVRKAGFDFGRRLEEVNPRVDLRVAIANLKKATGITQFQYVDVYRVINPRYEQPYYIFTSPAGVYTVGGDDGKVSQNRVPGITPPGCPLLNRGRQAAIPSLGAPFVPGAETFAP